jgi:large subunit ribosomal protein L21
MFAVIKTGGKQYKVASGDILRIEKVTGNTGDTVQFNEILMVGGEKPVVGAPAIAGAAVQAEILEQGKGPKLIHYVKRRRKHSSQRKRGHRQQITVLRVTDILAKGGEKSGVVAALNGAGFIPDVEPVKKLAVKKPTAEKAAPKKEAKPAVEKTAPKKEAKPAAKKAAPKKEAKADAKPAAKKAAPKKKAPAKKAADK